MRTWWWLFIAGFFTGGWVISFWTTYRLTQILRELTEILERATGVFKALAVGGRAAGNALDPPEEEKRQ